MSRTFNMVGSEEEKAALAIKVTNGTPTSVTATNGTKTVNLTLNGELPSGYTQLEYLESTGTQYINTGVNPSSNQRFILDYQFVTGEGKSSGAMKKNSWIDNYGVAELWNGAIGVAYSVSGTTIYSTTANIYDRYLCDYDYYAGKVRFNGADVGELYSGSFPSIPIYLFAANMVDSGANTPSAARLYSAKIITLGSTLTRNFVPAKRNSDSVLGMYDTVNNVFYTNAGTGTFIAGPTLWTGNVTPGTWTVTATDGTNSGSISVIVDDVKVYSRIVGMSELGGEYTKLQYLESSNAQYINTGYYPKATTSMKFRGWTYDGFGVGYISSTGGSRFCIFKSTNYNVGFGTEWNNVIGTWDADAGVVHDFYVSIPNRQAKFDNGSSVSLSGTFTVQTTYPFLIFGMHENGRILKSKIRTYVLELYENNVMIRKFTPARRNSDSVVGMYDTVNNVFYTNDGTGTFIAGPAA